MLRAAAYTGAQPTFTWATKPSSAANGSLIFVSDVGESGTLFQYGGSRWRPVGGQAALKTLGAASANVANSETIVLQTLIPASAWQTYDTLRLWLVMTKSGTTDAGNLTVRVGTAGTTGDTAITGLSAFQFLSAANTSGGLIFDIKLLSATSAQKMGLDGSGAGSYTGGSASGALATTITDASANALYLSVGIASAGATNTVSLASGHIHLITP